MIEGKHNTDLPNNLDDTRAMIKLIDPALSDKLSILVDHFKDLKEVVIAYSGGLDSTLLIAVAIQTIGAEKVHAVIINTPTIPPEIYSDAMKTAKILQLTPIEVKFNILKDDKIVMNPTHRCYLCKKLIISKCLEIASDKGVEHLVDGTHLDDFKSDRPGLEAIRELNVITPLADAGIDKSDVRNITLALNLPTKNTAPYSCLLTRFPHDKTIDLSKIAIVAKAEKFVRDLGYKDVKIFHLGDTARVTVGIDQIDKAYLNSKQILDYLTELGYSLVTIGVRTPS